MAESAIPFSAINHKIKTSTCPVYKMDLKNLCLFNNNIVLSNENKLLFGNGKSKGNQPRKVSATLGFQTQKYVTERVTIVIQIM